MIEVKAKSFSLYLFKSKWDKHSVGEDLCVLPLIIYTKSLYEGEGKCTGQRITVG